MQLKNISYPMISRSCTVRLWLLLVKKYANARILQDKPHPTFFFALLFLERFVISLDLNIDHKHVKTVYKTSRRRRFIADRAVMAADSLLPLFHENSAGPMSALPSDNDDVLAELLGGAGVSSVVAGEIAVYLFCASPGRLASFPTGAWLCLLGATIPSSIPQLLSPHTSSSPCSQPAR